MNSTLSPLESMVARAESLYTLPAVAMEVIQLTDAPEVDTRALKECIECDPALAAKILRVVNSSLFGLSGHVENLTQAIALLGIKPLKLLVLGFSLPDGLLEEMDVEQLRLYWRGSLTRAVAARQLIESQWKLPGDDAFLVALLQDIGKLVMLQQLGNPYVRFLTHVRTEHQCLVTLEQESIGFDHRTLTASLLQSWHLPPLYVESIQLGSTGGKMKWSDTTNSRDQSIIVPQVLHLTNMLVELVDEHRLNVLPTLLESGAACCGLDKESLNRLVAELEPRVEQLAALLQIDLGEGGGYTEVLTNAHQQLSIVAEQVAGEMLASETTLCEEILHESQELERALQAFTAKSTSPTATPPSLSGARSDDATEATPRPRGRSSSLTTDPAAQRQRLVDQVATTVAACRAQRWSLSLIRLELAMGEMETDQLPLNAGAQWMETMQRVRESYSLASEHLIPLSPSSWSMILPNLDRREAIELAKHIGGELEASSMAVSLKVGIGHVAILPKAFDAERLVEAAESCLAAAQSAGGTTIKSIEVY